MAVRMLLSNLIDEKGTLGTAKRIGGDGGGYPAGISGVNTGEVSLTEDAMSLTIEHGLGVEPTAFCLCMDGIWSPAQNEKTLFFMGVQKRDVGTYTNARIHTTEVKSQQTTNGYISVNADEETITFTITNNNQGHFVASRIVDSEGTIEPVTYRWYAVG